MENPYQTPESDSLYYFTSDNTSGMGKDALLPYGVSGWSWGAFMFNWIWAIFNKTYIGLLALVPYFGFIVSFWLGMSGREMAWRNKRWDSLEHFNLVQRKWSLAALYIFVGLFVLGLLSYLPIFADGPPQ